MCIRDSPTKCSVAEIMSSFVRTNPTERRKCDKDISVTALLNCILQYTAFEGTRDLNLLFSKLMKLQSEGGCASPTALSRTHDFYRMFFQVVRNGRVPMAKLEDAISNAHNRTVGDKSDGLGPLNNTGKPLQVFAAKIAHTVGIGAHKYRELKDNERQLQTFLNMSRPEDVSKATEMMALLWSKADMDEDSGRSSCSNPTQLQPVPMVKQRIDVGKRMVPGSMLDFGFSETLKDSPCLLYTSDAADE